MSIQLPTDIEANAKNIVQSVGHESVAVYRFLFGRYHDNDPKDDLIYQFVFRSFYRLDSAGLTPEFKSRFFELLSVAREKRQIDIPQIVRTLHDLPNRKGQSSLQFSFATKLANAVDSTVPIYDAEVATVFGFRPPYTYRPFEQRLSQYMEFYGELKLLYQSIIEANHLADARSLFREQYQCAVTEVSETKVLDFIFWSAGKLSREVL